MIRAVIRCIRPLSRAGGRGSVTCSVLACIATGLFGACGPPADEDSLRVRREQSVVEIENGLVKARFTPDSSGLRQEFFARTGGTWERVVVSFHPERPLPEGANKLYDTRITPHRYLVNEGIHSVRVERQGEEELRVHATGRLGMAHVAQTVTLRKGQPRFHFDVQAVLPGPSIRLEYLLSTFTFEREGTPTFVHTPGMRTPSFLGDDTDEQIIGDRIFYAPAVILQEGSLFAALAPDLDLINESRVTSPDARRRMNIPRNTFSVPIEEENYTMPTGIDLNVRTGLTGKPVFSFGWIDNVPTHHMRWLHPNDGSMVRTLDGEHVRYGFDLFVKADATTNRGYQDVSRFQWERYGRKEFQDPRPQAMPFEEYARLVYEANLNPLGVVHPPVEGYEDQGSWLEWVMGGEPVGGYRNSASFWLDIVSNGKWWNTVSDASGFYFWGEKLGDGSLIQKARQTINLALQAPQQEGLFPVIYKGSEHRWTGNHFDPSLEKVANYKAHFLTQPGWSSESYDVAAMSRTAAHLIGFYQKHEQDERIIPYARRYADGLLSFLGENGTVPAWITYGMKPHWVLRESAHPGASMWFLATLYEVTREEKYLHGAERIAAYMMRNVLPRQNWRDLEFFFSCAQNPLSTRDVHQGQPPRGVLSMLWGMRGFAALYRATGEKDYLDAGEQVVDYMGLYQTVWDPHYVYAAYAFGGSDTDNGEAAWLNGHQTQWVEPMIWYAKTLGRQDILERAVAAAHASVTLIHHPRHQANDIWSYPEETFSIFDVEEPPWGLGPENISHEGHPQSAARTSPSLGEGSAVSTGLGEAYRALGGAYVDVSKGLAVGVNGLRIQGVALRERTLDLDIEGFLDELDVPWEKPYATELRIVGLPDGGNYDLVLGNASPVKVVASQLARFPVVVHPDGAVRSAL